MLEIEKSTTSFDPLTLPPAAAPPGTASLPSPPLGERVKGEGEVKIVRRRPHRLRLYLIKPSKYDDDGYVIRHWKGVLPSNSLACLYGLTEDVRGRRVLGKDLEWKIELMDETVQKVDVEKITRSSRGGDTKTVICLVGVQSNQFPRARDLALAFRRAGLDVLVGGFHVSGVSAMCSELPSELEALLDAGVTLVAGEVEGRWEMILKDALEERLKPTYNFLTSPPDLSSAPMPKIEKRLLNRYAVRHFGTLDCGRGCPYQCSFCTVINVQGRRMRFRRVDDIVDLIRTNYRRHGIRHYFFTDDNFCRNKNWEAIFDGLTRLREEEDIPLSFMMQVDTQSYRIPNFIEKAAEAGCSQVFIGLESLNEENLKAARKIQNSRSQFRDLVQAYRERGIVTHLAYIIGFPFDSQDSVAGDVQALQTQLGSEQASFFMLTPLPGSADYSLLKRQGTVLDADLNNYDSFHETLRHSRMEPGEWTRAYQDAWKSFYGVENMVRILKRAKTKRYWGIFSNFIWYKNAVEVEGGHPMVHGFFRLKGRHERRPDFPLESRLVYFKRRARDLWRTLIGWGRLALEMEEVWLATRRRSLLEERVVFELAEIQKRVSEWRSLRLPELQSLYRTAIAQLKASANEKDFSSMRIPSLVQLWFQKWNVFRDSLTFTRSPMEHFWRNVWGRLRQGALHEIAYHKLIFMSIRETVLFSQFLFSFLKRSVAPA